MATDSFWGFALTKKERETNMSKKIKPCLTHEHETKIATYCAKNNLTFDLATAYDATMATFKDEPIMQNTVDENGGIQQVDVTHDLARSIEFHPKTIERIAAKIELTGEKIQQEAYRANIIKAKSSEKPDLDTLVDNLYRLNIVDQNGYLGLVCFLMQLKYTRDKEIPEDEKTCVFFNGVAHNGKSATARAICEVESQYGKVFKAHSGKLLESPHEEQVWKSHLNYFDEVKPSEVNRELLLSLINGGSIELNPKNKKQYNHPSKTNSIFTSNDMIGLKQRRVSVIKFGNRLNGRPLEKGTLKKIIEKIFDSLPSFERYFDIYGIVNTENERRLNLWAIEAIVCYLETYLGQASPENEQSLSLHKTFAPHNIYNCIKDKYSRQMIKSERKEAITNALEYLVKLGLAEQKFYDNCTTKNYQVSGINFIRIQEKFNSINTADEDNKKITKDELYTLMKPFFETPAPQPDEPMEKDPLKLSPEFIKINGDLVALRAEQKGSESEVLISTENLKQAKILYSKLEKDFTEIMNTHKYKCWLVGQAEIVYVIKLLLTQPLCQCLHYDVLISFFKSHFPNFDDTCKAFIMQRYKELTQCTDDAELELQARIKAPRVYDFQSINPVGCFYFQRYRKGDYQEALDELSERNEKENYQVIRRAIAFEDWTKTFKKGYDELQWNNSHPNQLRLPGFEELDDEIPF